MEQKHVRALLLIMSIAYGAAMALLPGDSGATELVAIIGGAVLAIGWATFGVLFVRNRDRGHE